MCFGGSSSQTSDTSGQNFAKDYLTDGHLNSKFDTDYGKNIDGWGKMSQDQKDAWFAKYYNTPADKAARGFDITTGQSALGTPQAPDLTDDLLQKTRTNFALRLQAGSNTKSSFGGTQLGGLTLGNSGLGGN